MMSAPITLREPDDVALTIDAIDRVKKLMDEKIKVKPENYWLRPGPLPMEPAPDPLQAQAEMILELTAERDALRAEVGRLTEQLEITKAVAVCLKAGEKMARREIERLVERLRKGKDDEQKCDRSHMVGETYSHCPQHPKSSPLAMVADSLDPRLGTPQPDGEPVPTNPRAGLPRVLT